MREWGNLLLNGSRVEERAGGQVRVGHAAAHGRLVAARPAAANTAAVELATCTQLAINSLYDLSKIISMIMIGQNPYWYYYFYQYTLEFSFGEELISIGNNPEVERKYNLFTYQAYPGDGDASVGSVEVWRSEVEEIQMMNQIHRTYYHSSYCCDTAGYHCANLKNTILIIITIKFMCNPLCFMKRYRSQTHCCKDAVHTRFDCCIHSGTHWYTLLGSFPSTQIH